MDSPIFRLRAVCERQAVMVIKHERKKGIRFSPLGTETTEAYLRLIPLPVISMTRWNGTPIKGVKLTIFWRGSLKELTFPFSRSTSMMMKEIFEDRTERKDTLSTAPNKEEEEITWLYSHSLAQRVLSLTCLPWIVSTEEHIIRRTCCVPTKKSDGVSSASQVKKKKISWRQRHWIVQVCLSDLLPRQ